ncbi:MAG: hypothetical protein ACRDVC_11150 [Acidimicrobiales bacterium]
MLLLVLALFWVALLAPVAIRRFRDGGSEKSIQSFHAEHEVLSRQDYVVAPAHRLDEPDDEPVHVPSRDRRPHLRVVHSDDTIGTLEARSTWDEWDQDYSFDEPAAQSGPETNYYARAYSSRPVEPEVTQRYEPPIRRRTMKAQRRIVFSRLVAGAALITLVAFLTGLSIFVDVAALAWFSVVLFIAFGLYAVSQGYLSEPSLKVRLPQRRQRATVEPTYDDHDEAQYVYYHDEFDSEFYEPETAATWQREPERRRALG